MSMLFANVCFVKIWKYFGRVEGCLHFFLMEIEHGIIV